MSYIMQAGDEFQRLERQSSEAAAYDFKRELAWLEVPDGAAVLDAGCGSGIVTRFLADRFATATVVGCDLAEERLGAARAAAGTRPNIRFETHDLTELDFASATFDVILARFVLHHLQPPARAQALRELYRCLKPGGRLVAVDFDGGFHNLFPATPFIEETLAKVEAARVIDLYLGRKLQALLRAAGFAHEKYRLETLEFQGAALAVEKEMIRERFTAARGFIAKVTGGDEPADRFVSEYLAALDAPDVVLFYNKFIVTGRKT